MSKQRFTRLKEKGPSPRNECGAALSEKLEAVVGSREDRDEEARRELSVVPTRCIEWKPHLHHSQLEQARPGHPLGDTVSKI